MAEESVRHSNFPCPC